MRSKGYLRLKQLMMVLERVCLFYSGYYLPIRLCDAIILLIASIGFHLWEFEFDYLWHKALEEENK